MLAANYETAGAFLASIAWYRAGAGTVAHSLTERPPAQGDRIAAPAQLLWPEHDPLFPPEWADRLEDYFARVWVHFFSGAGHFTPLECATEFADLVRSGLGPMRS